MIFNCFFIQIQKQLTCEVLYWNSKLVMNMKKITLFICTLICANVLIAQTQFTIGSITYEVIDSNEVKIYDYSGTDSVLVIPDTVAYQNVSYAVTEIGEYALAFSQSLTTITIPNNIRIINDGAFSSCSSLDSIIIPNSVTAIEHSTFYGCSSLTSITLHNSITRISPYAFCNCTGLTSFVIPDGIDTIYDATFRDCANLASITIPNSVTFIEGSAFRGCGKLTSIIIPDSVRSIGGYAFNGCKSLTSITIPNNVIHLGNAMFQGCINLVSITLPDSITSIGSSMFADCQSLASITIPINVTYIGDGAFYGCSSLQSISIPSNVSTIGSRAFMNCTNLVSISMPDSVTTISWYTFENCTSLTSITIPQSVTMIVFYAFNNCTSLQEVISLPLTPPNLYGFDFFLGIPESAVLKVPCHTDEYASSYWGNYFDTIQRIEGTGFYVNANVNNSDWGSVEIENNCTDTATLIAITNDCYQFQSWNDGNTDNPRTISLHQDSSFTAIFDLADDYNIRIYDTICYGERYTDNDFYAVQTGVYTRRLISSTGCDSVATLYLTVNRHSIGIDTIEACNSYTWIDGITYTQSTNSPTYTITNSTGCDSVVTLNLTIHECIYTLTATVFNNDTTGTVTGSGQYLHGDTATIMAVANNGFHFVQWNDSCMENPRKVVVTSDTTFSAIFGTNPPIATNDNEVSETLIFYPNPTSNTITFNRTDILKVEVLDGMGRLLMDIENKHIIDLSKLSEGLYTLRITLPEGIAVRKAIKQ